ncbi:MAG: molybdopterin-guanine dinucleotide biosynthesis protein A, partial [Caulobacter sp. 35-67-4]
MAESESGRFAAIILAAGLGSRFGGGKLLAPFRARPLIAGALESALTAPVGLVVIALGDDPDLEAAI